MLQARRALVVLISVIAALAGFTPAVAASAAAAKPAAPSAAASVRAAASESLGYWLVASDGGIFSGGDADFHGSTGAVHLNRPIVGVASTPSGDGYWMVASDGGIFSFGDAAFYGSTGAIHLNRSIVGIAPTPSGHGYWLVASDGGIFAFGDAAFYGSTGAMHLNNPIVGIGSTPSGHGYWLVASDGGMFSFGDAVFYGSTGAMHLNRPIVGMASTPTGRGYDLVASDGGIFSFGDAAFYGSTGAMTLNQPIVGMAATASGHGYWFVAADGGVFSFGDADFFGAAVAPNADIVGMVATAPVPVATKLAFTTEPGSSTGGSSFATQPVVTLHAASGDTSTADTSTVTLTVTTPNGATLDCADNSKAAVAGVATFSGCDIDKAGTYTLTATSSGLTNAHSASVTIAVGPATKLAITTQASGAIFTVPFGTQPVVTVQDAGGNTVTTDTSPVTLAIPAGATLACTANPKAAVAGVATFAGCNISAAGAYVMTATAASLTAATSASVAITTAAAKVAVTTEPSAAATGGSNFAVQPVVKVQDATGHTIVADTSSVTLSLTGAPAGATLACTANPKAAVAGVVTFAGCNVNLPGTYTLTATDVALTAAVSASVVVTVGAPAKLAFTAQPVGANGAANFATQPEVTVQDAGGNTVVGATSSVTLALTGAPVGAGFGCTANSVAAVAGVATFAGCKINTAAAYTLTASDGFLLNAVSSSLTITVGSAAKLAFTTQPGNGTGGVSLTTGPVVTVQDAGGNTVGTDTTNVTVALTAAGGAALACTGTTTHAASGGVATFAACNINLLGTYTLTASDGGLVTAVSSTLTIAVGVPAKVGFTTQPAGALGGAAFTTQPAVKIQDAGGNTVVGDTSSVTLALTTPGTATLLCTSNPLGATAGVATFGGCKIDVANTYTLTAAVTGLATGTSASLTVAVGGAAKLGFTTQPGNATGGLSLTPGPVVAVQDAGGNTVVGDTSSVTLALTAAGGATLACTGTTTHAASAGVATFAACNIDHAGPYTLTASDGALVTAVSSSLTITVGPAAKLGYTQQPSATGSAGFSLGAQPAVAIQDAGGNTVTTDPNGVTLTLAPTAGGAALTCTNNPQAPVSGLSTFLACSINNPGTYTLTASASTYAVAISNSIVIS